MRTRRPAASRALRLGLAVLAVCAAAVPPSHATQRQWAPGQSPCGPSLQACIDFATAGDTVVVAHTGTIAEDLTIAKSLTLRVHSDHTATLADFPFVLLSNPFPLANVIRFEGFYLDRGRVAAVQESNQRFGIEIRDLVMSGTVNSLPQIQVRVGNPNPLDLFEEIDATIEDNWLTIPPGSQSSSVESISVSGGDALSLNGVIRNNRIANFDGDQQGAIGLYNLSSAMHVDVVRNGINGNNFNNGVLFFQFGPGTANLRFLGNLVSGQVNEAGAPGAFVVNVSEGTATFEIVNNSAVQCDNGILIHGADEVGAAWSGVVANNLVARMTNTGIGIEQPDNAPTAVENDHNLVYR